jgi:hypothetical protein
VRSPRLIPALVGVTLLAAACGGGTKPAAVANTPSASPTSPSPTPTATQAAATCPLTGVAPGKGQDIHRAALAVKIDNINAARPQAGVNKADVVVEELVEGGLTRLFAVYQCDSAGKVGPIRSARTSDADLLALLHGSVFGFSGANPGALPPIRAHGNSVLISYDALGGVFYRDGSRPAPHNVFSSTSTMLKAGLARRSKLTAPKPLFSYGPASKAAKPATSVAMSWPQASAGWHWTGSNWARTQNGTADTLVDGSRVTAANVVVMSIAIGSTGLRDVLGNASPLDITVGSGKVWLFRDGSWIGGTWHRAKIGSPLRFVDASGAPLLLHPGRTWLELLPRPRVPKAA